MLKKLLALILFLLIVVGIGLALYFTFRTSPSKNQGPDIVCSTSEIETRYYIKELRHNMYNYPGTSTNIKPNPQDNSYCIFENNFQTFRIFFRHTIEVQFDFIISEHKKRKGSLTATLHHIYNGEIYTYKLSTTRTRIVLTATIKYRVMVTSEEYKEVRPQWISRKTTVFMSFARIKPDYITEMNT